MKKSILLLIAICFLLGSVRYSYALIIEETFDSDPFANGWETNNPSRYYWDSANGSLHTENYTNSGDYATKDIYYNGESFHLEFDIKVGARDTGDVNIGLFGPNRLSNGYETDERLYMIFGGYENQILIEGFNSGEEWIYSGSGSGLLEVDTWFNVDIFYDASIKTIALQVEKNGGNVLDWQTTMNYGFSSDLQHLGVSMVGSWVTSNRYEAADIDNIKFTYAPVPEPTTMLLLGSGIAGLAGFRRKIRKR